MFLNVYMFKMHLTQIKLKTPIFRIFENRIQYLEK